MKELDSTLLLANQVTLIVKRSRNMGRLLAWVVHRKGAFCADLGFDTVVTTIPIVMAFLVIISLYAILSSSLSNTSFIRLGLRLAL